MLPQNIKEISTRGEHKLNFKFLSSSIHKIKKLFNKIWSSKKLPQRNTQEEGMGVDLIKYIQDADSQISAIHDIKIKINSNLHKFLLESGQIKNQKNKGIKFIIPTQNANITVNALVYPKTIQIDIGCSYEVFTNNEYGKKQFALLLNLICTKLCECSDHKATIPETSQWILTHYHYGRDGHLEYNGEKFHITARNALGEFVRTYSKKMLDGNTIVRIEKIKTPHITVDKFLSDKGEKNN